ncbi:MFS transporter [Leifsonia kafniensis]|uniref:MFS transporter n=1 Tax=Leifsonia kafniensis TaxID=475957 RepID=A0ABP7KW93_9MICO
MTRPDTSGATTATTISTDTASNSLAETLSPARRWAALALLLTGIFIGLVDMQSANLLVPALTESFGASTSTLSWFIGGYTLAYGVSLIPAGRLGDRYGHKIIFTIGLAGYVLTSLGTSLAQDTTQLIILRVCHGLMGGMVVAPVFAYIQLLFTGRRRVRAFGFFLATTGVGSLIAPFVAAWSVDGLGADPGWRVTVAFSAVLGTVALLFTFKLLPRINTASVGSFDVFGVILSAVVFVALLLPLIQSDSGALPGWAIWSFATSLLAAIIFVFWQRSIEKRGGLPLLRLSLFKLPEFSFGLLTLVLAFASFTASIFIALTTLWVWGLGNDESSAALMLLPLSLGGVVGGLVADRFQALVGRFAVTISLVILTVGNIAIWLMVQIPDVGMLTLALPFFIAGAASGLFFGPINGSILARVPEIDAGSAGGTVVTLQRVGSALGSSVVFIVLMIRPGVAASDFTPDDWAATSINALLVIALFSAAGLVLSILIDFLTRNETAVREAFNTK